MKAAYRLIIAVAVLAVIVFVLYRPEKPPVAPPPDKPLLTVDAAKVQRIDIQQPQDPAVVLQRDGSGWQLVEPYAFAADSARVGDMLGTLNDITGAEKVGTVTNLAEYGLDHPGTVTLTLDGGKTETVSFGSLTPTGGNAYLQINGGPVEVAPAPIKSGLLKTAFELQDKMLVHFPAGKVTELVITHGGQRLDFKKTGGAWPKDRQSAIDALLDALQDAEMSSMVDRTGKEAALHGLTRPATTVKLIWDGGSAQLEVGASKDVANYFGRNAETPAVFLLDSYIVHDITGVVSPAKAAAGVSG